MVKDVVKLNSHPKNRAAILANSYRQVTKRFTPCRVFLLPLVYHTSETLSTPIFKMQKLRCCSQRKRLAEKKENQCCCSRPNKNCIKTQNLHRCKQRKLPAKKSWVYFRKSAGLPQPSVVCCCADRKGGTTYEKYDK